MLPYWTVLEDIFMAHLHTDTLRPDAKGRITLGKLAEGISSFHVSMDKEGRIILEPYAEIPAREAWLFKNPKALASVKRGLEQSAKGETKDLGDFSKYTKDES